MIHSLCSKNLNAWIFRTTGFRRFSKHPIWFGPVPTWKNWT